MSRFVLTAQLQLQAPNNVAQVVRQIQSQLNNVSVNVQVQGAAQAQRQLQQVTAQTQAATTAADRMGRAFAVSIRRFAAFSIATRAVGLFTSTLSDAVKEAINFQREMVRVSQVTGESLGKLKFLTKAITDLSTGLGVSSKDLLTTGQLLLQAGVNAKDTEVALKTLAKAALAPNFDSLSETTEGAIAILAQFQEGVGALETQLGAINAVAGAFAVEAGDLIDVIRRAGGVFKSSGGDLNELIALFTSVRATTRESAESIGTGLRTIFTRIQRPKTIEFLKQFGVELVDLEGRFVGPFEAVKRLSGALSGLGEGDITFIRIAEELGGFRQIGKVLPLLQQFSTAQSALNVAQKAGNSLTTDAATAQQALAVRILKVKEEFLALIRSVTETTTFQVMANTALSLASALIKIGEAIKPLLPLLAAVAAVNFAKGIGTFAGGIMRGMQSGRTYSTGGKVHHFARGGMVPGTGNRDTVPAMLQPGEFVIKKSSVNKLGASNLAAMNENRFALGGQARKFGIASLLPMDNPPKEEKATIPVSNIRQFLSKKAGGKNIVKKGNLENVDNTIRGILGLKGQQSVKTSAIAETMSRQDVASKIEKRVELSIQKLIDNSASALGKSLSINVERKADNSIVKSVGSASTIGSVFEGALAMLGAPMDTGKGEQDPIDFPRGLGPNFASAFQSLVGIPVDAKRTASKKILKDTANRKAAAYLANAVYGDPRWQTLLRPTATSNSNKKWQDIKSGEFVDYKTLGYSSLSEARSAMPPGFEARRKGSGSGFIRKFASGGGVGTDTVPALLTPGEFVVNRSSAQSIGYGNLNRMNKVGRYAKGGVVQRFSSGTTMSGAQPSTGGSLAAWQSFTTGVQQATQSVTQNADSVDQNTGTLIDMAKNNRVFTASIIATAPAIIQGFLPALDEASSGMLKVTHYMLGLATTLTSVMFALEAFGVSLSAKSIMQLFGSGPGGLGSLMKNAFSGFKMGAAGMAGPQPLGGGIASRIGGMFGTGKAAIGSGLSKASDLVSGRLGGFAGRASASVGGAMDTFGQTSFGRGFSGGRQGINPLFAAAKGKNPLVGMSGQMGVSALKTGIQQLGFGGRLAANAGGFLGKGAGVLGKAGGLAARAGGAIAGGLGGAGSAALSMAGPISGITGFIAILNGAVGAFKDLDGQLQRSIQAGKVEEASKLAVAKAAGDFPLIGNLLQGWSSDFDNLLVSAGTIFGGPSLDSVKALAASQAGAVKTQKQLEQAQKTATNAMEDFENGSITAAEALAQVRAATSEVGRQEKRASDFAEKNLENRASDGFTGRNIASFLTFGAVESSSQRNQRLGGESAEQIRQASRFQAESFQMESAARSATIRSGFARGQSSEEIRNQALGVGTDNDLQKRLAQQIELVNTLQEAGDEKGAAAARESVNQLSGQINQVNRETANLEKEVARSKAAFAAMNLGLRGPTATATAMSASMNRFAAGLEVGGSTFSANAEFLSEAMSSAAQAMNPDDIKSAIDGVSNNLKNMGVDPTKFRANMEGFIKVQQDYTKSFANVRSNLQARLQAGQKNAGSADEVRKALIEELTAGLEGDAKQNITAILGNLKLEQADIDKFIATGDFSAFGDQITEAGKKQVEEIMKIAQERQKAEQVVIGFIQQRAEAERNLAQAQKDAIDMYMEGRDVQAKYGGREVTYGERRASILARANTGAASAGVGALRTGSVSELRQRQMQIVGGFANIEQRRSQDGGMEGRSGAKAAETQKALDQAQKDQVDTIRSLIKLEEEELKILQEKNRMEKDSLESLISGDVEKFFEGQAASGAQAAIAAGDMRTANMFGAKAIADAFKDIQRQQEAGVQSMFGRQLGGPGGLAEQAAQASLASRGIMDPRMAQVLAGTTPEEEARRANLRELGGVLGETGMAGAAMAEMQVQTANINVTNAQFKLSEIEDRGREAANMNRGGVVYANRGIFVPRGTDTVPAMLTPGEFVVRREAVNRGNNLQMLHAMNNGGNSSGMARGGKVGYYNSGGRVQYKRDGGILGNIGGALGIDPQLVTTLGNVFTKFVTTFNDSIKNLQNTKLQIKMDSVNVNVNLNASTMLNQISQEAKTEIMRQVVTKIQQDYSVGPNGKLTENRSNMPK